jgi:hypothetical protein
MLIAAANAAPAKPQLLINAVIVHVKSTQIQMSGYATYQELTHLLRAASAQGYPFAPRRNGRISLRGCKTPSSCRAD